MLAFDDESWRENTLPTDIAEDGECYERLPSARAKAQRLVRRLIGVISWFGVCTFAFGREGVQYPRTGQLIHNPFRLKTF